MTSAKNVSAAAGTIQVKTQSDRPRRRIRIVARRMASAKPCIHRLEKRARLGEARKFPGGPVYPDFPEKRDMPYL